MKILPVGSEVWHVGRETGRRADMAKKIVAFRKNLRTRLQMTYFMQILSKRFEIFIRRDGRTDGPVFIGNRQEREGG